MAKKFDTTKILQLAGSSKKSGFDAGRSVVNIAKEWQSRGISGVGVAGKEERE